MTRCHLIHKTTESPPINDWGAFFIYLTNDVKVNNYFTFNFSLMRAALPVNERK